MSEKRIKTKEEKKLVIYDILFIIFLNIFMYLVDKETIIHVIKTAIETSKMGNAITTAVLAVFNFFFMVDAKIWILIIIYLAFRITKTKAIKQNTTYKETYGIEYYRDKMPFLTATEISLITDLGIENKKDLSASLLSLYQREVIRFENNKIIINENKLDNIKESEKKLIEIVASEQINDHNVKAWREKCIQEAIQNGYIRKARKDRYSYLNNINKIRKSTFKIWGITFLILVVLIMTKMIPEVKDKISSKGNISTSTNETIQNNNSNYSIIDSDKMIDELMKNPIYIIVLIIHCISAVILIYAIIYKKSKMVIVKSNESMQNNYERTEIGNELAEKIAGIKKYIEEFSLLSQREKEEIVLWEDFLIYAVLLEENEKIIKDIFSYKNLNISILDYCNRISGNVKNILESLTASQLFDNTYYINRIAHIFYKILTEDVMKIKIEEYYYLWYHFNNLNQNEKDILKSDIENIMYENNNIDIMNNYNEKYEEIKNNTKLKKMWQKHMEEMSKINSGLNSYTYEDLYRTINYIAKLV